MGYLLSKKVVVSITALQFEFEDTKKTTMNLEDILGTIFNSPEKEYVVTFNKHVEVKSSHSRIQHRKQQVYTVAKWWPSLSASFR